MPLAHFSTHFLPDDCLFCFLSSHAGPASQTFSSWMTAWLFPGYSVWFNNVSYLFFNFMAEWQTGEKCPVEHWNRGRKRKEKPGKHCLNGQHVTSSIFFFLRGSYCQIERHWSLQKSCPILKWAIAFSSQCAAGQVFFQELGAVITDLQQGNLSWFRYCWLKQ